MEPEFGIIYYLLIRSQVRQFLELRLAGLHFRAVLRDFALAS